MTVGLLFQWPFLLFLAPAAVAVLYLGLYLLTGLDVGEADAEVSDDGFVDADPDVSADLHLEPAAASAAPAASAGDASALVKALNLLGFGRVPASIVIVVFLLTWGFAGFVTLAAAVNAARAPADAVWSAVAVALGVAIVATGLVSRLVGRWLPTNENFGVWRTDLVGRVGESATPIDGEFGRVVVRDVHGDRHEAACRVGPDADPIPAGTAVVLVRYCPAAGFFYVVPEAWWNDRAARREQARRDCPRGESAARPATVR